MFKNPLIYVDRSKREKLLIFNGVLNEQCIGGSDV